MFYFSLFLIHINISLKLLPLPKAHRYLRGVKGLLWSLGNSLHLSNLKVWSQDPKPWSPDHKVWSQDPNSLPIITPINSSHHLSKFLPNSRPLYRPLHKPRLTTWSRPLEPKPRPPRHKLRPQQLRRPRPYRRHNLSNNL